jgi:PAS domain-containing protein
MSPPNDRRFKFLMIYCELSALAVAAMGGLILCGWAFHIELLKSIFPGGVAINANMALLLALSGTSLWLLLPGDARTRLRHIARFLATLVTVMGAATRIEYLFGVNLRIDQLLFTEPAAAVTTSFPGRMSQTSSVSFMAIGVALLVLEWKTKRGRRPSQGLSLWPALVALVAITGYTYRATALNRVWLYTHVPMPMAIALFLLSGAVFFARPRTGIAGDLTGEGSGSAMARRLLPAVFLIPLLLGWICLHGQRSGLYGTELGLAIYSASNVVVFGVLVWLNTRKMNLEYAQRSAAETEIRTLNAELEGRVAERTQALEQQTAVLAQQAALLDLAHDAIVVRDMQNRIVFWNRGAEMMYGWPANLALGKIASELLELESSQPIEEINAQLLQQGTSLRLPPQLLTGRAFRAGSEGSCRSGLSFWYSPDPNAAANTRATSLQTVAPAKSPEAVVAQFRQSPANLALSLRPAAASLGRRFQCRRENARTLDRPFEPPPGNGFPLSSPKKS